jgi:hypothetical protein
MPHSKRLFVMADSRFCLPAPPVDNEYHFDSVINVIKPAPDSR